MDTPENRLKAIANILAKIDQHRWIEYPSMYTYVRWNELPKDEDHDKIVVQFPYLMLIELLSIGTVGGETHQHLIRGNEIVRICSGWWYADSLLERLCDEDFEVEND